ncbi:MULTISPECIES: GTPase Era [Rheinheimera]|jgi:GTP-binding protein Era|uniref:GTPase Era n=1 Tax=Rheinheimera tangshanensis TaxID=400153 RepID=A0A5C8LVK5_9GAMM|nr:MULTISPECIES: GTPase Era [Rheinheimera]KOO59430.1 GTPase Era [Rheinheimera sp. KL1]MBP8227710.1 GTPase Era [Rheinheimera sp.]TXK79180.1 GTPase Era [Rheinheimera tangshanensis]GGM68000.1 GTPase Era [Rheinheimera tangshanensis]
MTTETFAGLVAIVGRPNVGKSTLLNQLVGQKVSITSRKPQTTRHRIVGIDTQDNYQTVYVDTPGLHIEEKRAINRLMNKAAASTILDVELIIFVVEGTRWTDDDQMVLNRLIAAKKPVLLVVNKVDLYKDKEELLPHLQWLSSQLDFMQIVPLSAEKGTNVQELRALVQKQLPPCEFFFPEEYVTDRSSRFMASEIVREKLMRFLGDELPYAVTVEIERFKWEEKHYHIAALVLVERDTQKQMVIGKKGERIKTIATEARKDMETLFEQPVFLQVWVKVKSGWADDERALRSLGYGED